MDDKTVNQHSSEQEMHTGSRRPPPPGFRRKPIREQLNTPIEPTAECLVAEGRPFVLYAAIDYAEDWSGEYIREISTFALLRATKISPDEFWRLVRLHQRTIGVDAR